MLYLCREDVGEYCKKVRKLALELLEAISESLGVVGRRLEKDYTVKALGNNGLHLAINYYPPSPQPELTYGLPSHADHNPITILLQDDMLPSLQVISNESVLHRAMVNCEKEKMSIPTFYGPSPDAMIGPAAQLVDNDPLLYSSFTYSEYYQKF
ncbi:hypothetical protein L6164_013326 [Bauhinia variegata]|uniref:Uncharacterized protein n=1 Tax=Bauhinia variegata TaxID=167791 RepID=A0ACB9PBQ4_BAUVA|nr:hypothetical protein L6164_013326 [Bauhinia variegata]